VTLKFLDQIEIQDGATRRRIALYAGDLAALPEDHKVDILVVSAFRGGYQPVRQSVIGALYGAGLSVEALAAHKAYDLTDACSFWLSQPITGAAASLNIGRIACFEPKGMTRPATVVGDLFRGLFPFLDHRRDQVVAMSLLASGVRQWPPDLVLRAILNAAMHWMARGLPISELKIVVLPDLAGGILRSMALFKETMPSLSQETDEASAAKKDYDVFLSFSTADVKAAEHAKTELLKRNDCRKVFDFRLEIDKGKSWQDEIDRAITSCRAIVALMSPSYFASPECQEELWQARLRNKRSGGTVLFPIYWRDYAMGLDLWLQILNYADCREESIENLTTHISKFVFT
jgi:hypothetical protein